MPRWPSTICRESSNDLDARVADFASRGIEPHERITYPGKAIYRDADGNEISFGGAIDSVE